MKFSVITPTYKRKEALIRAVSSLTAQTYKDWEIIIVNDSPQDTSYTDFASSINDPRIHYHVNTVNKGVNYSRNHAISKVSADSTWVIFLDDDDYFAPDTLQTFYNLIVTNADQKWFVTNRAYKNGTSVTKFPVSDTTYNYVWQYLITKRLKGDATHCIETKLITHNKINFSLYVRQAEEWFFFYQVGLRTRMYYHDHNSTITDGYNTAHGLNFRKRVLKEEYEALIKLFYEASAKKIVRVSFVVYILIRSIKLLIPKIR